MHCLTILGTRSHSPGGPPPPLSLNSSTPESLPVRAPPFDDNDSFEPPWNNLISLKTCVASVNSRIRPFQEYETFSKCLSFSLIYIYMSYREAHFVRNLKTQKCEGRCFEYLKQSLRNNTKLLSVKIEIRIKIRNAIVGFRCFSGWKIDRTMFALSTDRRSTKIA